MKKRYILGLTAIGLVGCDQKQPPQAPPAPAPTQQTAPAPAPAPVPALPAPKADAAPAAPAVQPGDTPSGPENEMKPAIPAPATASPFGSKGDAAAPALAANDGKTPTTLSRSDTQNSDTAVLTVKQATLNSVNPGTRIGKALDNRAMCKQVTWRAATDSAGGGTKKLVQYKCDLTNYQSIFNQKLAMANDKAKLIPTEMAQTVTFAVEGDNVTAQRCRIQYQLPTKKNKAFVENPHCLNLAYDSQYTSGWNDVISTVISRAAKS